MDIMLPEAAYDGDDQALAEAMRGVPTVVGYAMRFDGGAIAAACEEPTLPLVVLHPPGAAGTAFIQAAAVGCTAPAIAKSEAGGGFLNASPDSDGRMRLLPMVMEQGGQYYPSLALAVLDTYEHISKMQLRLDSHGVERLRLDHRELPLEGRGYLRLHYRGPRRTFAYVSAADVLGGRLPAEALKGKIALIGASAAGLESTIQTPTDPLFPPVEIQATAMDNLVLGDVLRRPSDAYLWEVSLALLAGLMSVIALALIRSMWGGVITVALIGVLWLVCVEAAKQGVLLSPMAATAMLGCNFVVLTMLNYGTERKRAQWAEERAEEVLHESESRYQRLVENVNDAIITADPEGRLMFANRRFREWFGLGSGDLQGLVLEDYVAPDWRELVREQHRRVAAGETETGKLEYEGVRANGGRIWIEALVASVKEGGRIVATQSALRDMTERKRLEAQYLQAQKMESVGRLAGGVAHDFNNLLTVINGYSDLLGAKLSGDAQLQDMARQIHRAGQRAAELTAQLLTFSRKQVVQLRPIDLNAVVQEAYRMLHRLVGEDIQCETHLRAAGNVQADPGQMQQVLMNLVVNARDAMPEGGKVTIATENFDVDEEFTTLHPDVPPGSYVCLVVADTGCGMSEAVRQRIFEPFFTTKEKGKGTGLGLSTVHGVVRQSGGFIYVESELGVGTTFEIFLPLIQRTAETGQVSQQTTPARGWETVLLVEDQAAVRELTEEMLRAKGYRVLSAASGSEAIDLARAHSGTIHLLITDVILPQMNGRALADALKRDRPQMKVLYISGYSDEVVARRGVLEKGLSYLAKPYTGEALAAKVRETLGDAAPGAVG
jgi:PAS domain S-box-containing protein